jgi:hypothetical protein
MLTHAHARNAAFCTRFIALLLFLSGTLLSHSADFVVSNTTQLASSMGSLKPGDSLVLATGTWANVDLLFKGKGMPAAPFISAPRFREKFSSLAVRAFGFQADISW